MIPNEFVSHPPPEKNYHNKKILVCILLILGVLIVFGQVGVFEFIRYDDELYVTKNPHVLSGLSASGALWALTTFDAGNWHPLTWISLMVDRELYGMDAGGYHWTNVILHVLSGLLLFLVFNRMTGELCRSGLVAGLFLMHPLHVESVAWVAARKDVLSGLFWMLCMWSYVKYAERPGAGRYWSVVLFFAAGLMSKPVVVTLPFVLLLLDYWPLRRFPLSHQGNSDVGGYNSPEGPNSKFPGRRFAPVPIFHLIGEKVPLLLISLITAVVTWKAQKGVGALLALNDMPLDPRLTNAVISYARYLVKVVWPFNLSFFYPHPLTWPSWQVILAGLLLTGMSIWTLHRQKSRPYLAVGWLWFFGTLIPMIGLVQVGSQAMADRYAYIPLIGISVMAVWGSFEAFNQRPAAKIFLSPLWCLILASLTLASLDQVQYWRNSLTLFTHGIAVTDRNYVAHNNLGVVLMDQKSYGSAATHFLEALRIRPNYPDANSNMGKIMALQGKYSEAEAFFRKALSKRSDYPEARRGLCDTLQLMGKFGEAIICYREALSGNSDDETLHNNIAVALFSTGEREEAILHLRNALRLNRGYGNAKNNLDALTGQASLPRQDHPPRKLFPRMDSEANSVDRMAGTGGKNDRH